MDGACGVDMVGEGSVTELVTVETLARIVWEKYRHEHLDPGCEERASRRMLIAIAGIPGSGKTFLAERIAVQINKLSGESGVAVALGMDGFHLYRRELDAMPNPLVAHERRGAPFTFDVLKLGECLARTRNEVETEVRVPSFDHSVGDPDPKRAIVVSPVAKIVIVEGNYLLLHDYKDGDGGERWNDISSLFDIRWLLATPVRLALYDRLCQRHMKAWGWTKERALARIQNNDEPNAKLILQHSIYDRRFQLK
eukprot:TRINITY_DN1170_c0_g1_i1.p1 TRINITY_DN1170_c0_g1~~TRINITY_DN1170_c0_g1_i1.p1  ORF type:complete len:253 (-),score=33.11 TRINITY_DN1170_c0_g1_i1:490-1248(-)